MKLSFFSDYINLYIENPKDYIKKKKKKLLGVINAFSKAEGYKLNIKFPCTNGGTSEKEIKK